MAVKMLLKKPSAWIPIAIPLAFFMVLLFLLATSGVPTRETDEGVGAHLFQIWLALEPFMLGYFALKWVPQTPKPALIILALQIIAALLPIGTVFGLGL